jgi:hypothetical protein
LLRKVKTGCQDRPCILSCIDQAMGRTLLEKEPWESASTGGGGALPALRVAYSTKLGAQLFQMHETSMRSSVALGSAAAGSYG